MSTEKSKKKKPGMKKSTKIISIVAAFVIVSLATVGALLLFLPKSPTSTLRYDVVRVDDLPRSSSSNAVSVATLNQNSQGTASSLRAANNNPDPYYLSNSFYDDTTYYYVYYLGYVKSVPIISGTAIRYDKKTPINISFTKTQELSTTITNSLTTATERTFTNSQQLSVGVSASIGFKLLGCESKITASLGLAFTWEHSTTNSVANTIERAESKMTGESFTISATIGDNNESEGVYRYSLFGTTDVYYVLEVNKEGKTFKAGTTSYCARPDIAWGIDYATDGDFGKTSNSKDLVIPEGINYADLPAPIDKLEGAPVEEPTGPNITLESLNVFSGWVSSASVGASMSHEGKDAEIDDGKDKITSFNLEVSATIDNEHKQYAHLKIIFVVFEGGTASNRSKVTLTFTKTIDLGHSGFIEFYPSSSSSTYQFYTGQEPANFKCTGIELPMVGMGTADTYNLIQYLSVVLDGPGGDDDADGIRLYTDIRIWYYKNNE